MSSHEYLNSDAFQHHHLQTLLIATNQALFIACGNDWKKDSQKFSLFLNKDHSQYGPTGAHNHAIEVISAITGNEKFTCYLEPVALRRKDS